MLLMLAALGLAIFGVVQLGRTLTPGQRVALAVTFFLALVWLVLWLIKTGVLGRATDALHR
jgi:predicted membrane channel-forming protein YqfA (hemolysin III family)